MRRGPKHKMCRRVGAPICGQATCPAHKRPYPAGSHGRSRRRRPTEYEIRLLEKQKLRAMYALRERQFRRYVDMAMRARGETGQRLLGLLEQRLDSVILRLGFGRTIHEARQVVSHGHVYVDGRRVNVPSALVKPGQTVEVRPKDHHPVQEALQSGAEPPSYVTRDEDNARGELLRVPTREEIPYPVEINDRLVVEFYSR